ncbi:MAG: hypothetical protein WCG19_03980 [Chlorobiaceae bacterium]
MRQLKASSDFNFLNAGFCLIFLHNPVGLRGGSFLQWGMMLMPSWGSAFPGVGEDMDVVALFCNFTS